jgi:outer membrane lipoprotein SlyB
MHKRRMSLIVAMLLKAGAAQADTVIGEVPDTLPGKGFGGLSGFMVGATAGGPVGAAIGAGLGWLVGGATLQATGLSDAAYRVSDAAGRVTTVRSPGRTWSAGERVRAVNGRLVAAGEHDSDARSVSAVSD